MYDFFGYGSNLCKYCSHLQRRQHDRTYIKCDVYGITASEATDWKVNQPACGMFNKPYTGIPVIEALKHSTRKKDEEPFPGQLSLFEEP